MPLILTTGSRLETYTNETYVSQAGILILLISRAHRYRSSVIFVRNVNQVKLQEKYITLHDHHKQLINMSKSLTASTFYRCGSRFYGGVSNCDLALKTTKITK